jgi:hypothetical protein
MRAKDAFPSKYIKAADVKERPSVVVIAHLGQEAVGQGAEQKEKHVLYFESGKPLVLNRINWDTLEEAFGDSIIGPGIRSRCTPPVPNIRASSSIAFASNRSRPSRRSSMTSRTESRLNNLEATSANAGGSFHLVIEHGTLRTKSRNNKNLRQRDVPSRWHSGLYIIARVS